MKKAVIYARYSSEKQTEQSIEGQLSVCYKYAQDKDYQVVGQAQVVGEENREVDLVSNLYELSLLEKEIDNIDALVPRYLKDVEAKKICL